MVGILKLRRKTMKCARRRCASRQGRSIVRASLLSRSLEREAARERQIAGREVPESFDGEFSARIGSFAGVSGRTVEKIAEAPKPARPPTNETTAIPVLLEKLAAGRGPEGAVVTIDAIACNPQIAQSIGGCSGRRELSRLAASRHARAGASLSIGPGLGVGWRRLFGPPATGEPIDHQLTPMCDASLARCAKCLSMPSPRRLRDTCRPQTGARAGRRRGPRDHPPGACGPANVILPPLAPQPFKSSVQRYL